MRVLSRNAEGAGASGAEEEAEATAGAGAGAGAGPFDSVTGAAVTTRGFVYTGRTGTRLVTTGLGAVTGCVEALSAAVGTGAAMTVTGGGGAAVAGAAATGRLAAAPVPSPLRTAGPDRKRRMTRT
ncbi:MAG: hypothetical protein WBY94_31300, partial [Polyangiaceae bacterium]